MRTGEGSPRGTPDAPPGATVPVVSGSSPPAWEPREDRVARRLKGLADELERDLGPAVRVERDPLRRSVTLTPARQDALGVTWTDFGTELQVDTASGFGGRFELSRTDEDVDFVEAVVRSVVAGRVVEIFARDRSRLSTRCQTGHARSRRVIRGFAGACPCQGGPAGVAPCGTPPTGPTPALITSVRLASEGSSLGSPEGVPVRDI